MKIRILKDIPGYKAGQVVDHVSTEWKEAIRLVQDRGFSYEGDFLIKGGWAEEVKDEIDIEGMRKDMEYIVNPYRGFGPGFHPELSDEEARWFTAFRIVKAVIEKLNENIEIMDRYCEWEIDYHFGSKTFGLFKFTSEKHNLLPQMATEKIGNQVIKLCKPELEILFAVNK